MSGATDNPDIAKFLSRQKVGVIATANPSNVKPHAATIYFMADNELNIYFVTRSQTAKYQNLISNPQAFLVVFEQSSQTTAQIFGSVERIEDKVMLDKVLQDTAQTAKTTAGTETTPVSRIEPGQYILFRLRPQSMRLADFKYSPSRYIFEIGTQPEQLLN